jgi:hypothetical protein
VFINLTPHQITVRTAENDIVINPTAPAARMALTSVSAGQISGIPLVRQEFGEIENLPAPVDGVIYITSTMVAQRAKRADVVSPDTGPTAIRENGQVVAVRAMQVFA